MLEISPHLVVATGIPVLGDQPAIDLHGRMPLLRRGRGIGSHDRIDEGLERAEHWGRPGCGECIRLGLRVPDRLADGVPADAELLGW
ncbi:hypothetical protein FRUB_05988 [Fimbriiglobus ruber]|uniref:Uncharacterized protein n=1 Tax=Fimbriiglobus ruber TaxID=1908690 RepID=A0A225DSP4_9BACT|nr:hypothetical protein FRUB_05988 [Fimbriiglobus ruber]